MIGQFSFLMDNVYYLFLLQDARIGPTSGSSGGFPGEAREAVPPLKTRKIIFIMFLTY